MNVIKIPNIVTLELSVEEINLITNVLQGEIARFKNQKLFGENFFKMCQLEEQFRELKSNYEIKGKFFI